MTNKINIVQENSTERHIPVTQRVVRKLARGAMHVVGIGTAGAILGFVGNEVVAAHHATPEGSDTYTIQPGDRLDGIAVEEVPNGADNVDDTVDAIRDMNEGLKSGNLQTGTDIEIPERMVE